MTGDDLRALSAAATPCPWEQGPDPAADWMIAHGHEWPGAFVHPTDAVLVVWLRNHADALADLIDAARPFADGCSCGDCHRLTAAFTALDQEAPT